MKDYIKSFSLLVACLGMSTQANAFWDQAHQLVGELASKKINSETSSQVNSLLKVKISYPGSELLSQNTNSMDTAASWADNIKGYYYQSINSNLSLCHYTDIPLKKDMINKDVSDEEINKSLKEELNKLEFNSVSCLKSSIKTLASSKESEVNKAIALRLVIHILGDIGQPLHNVSLIDDTLDDSGGNKIKFEEKVIFTNIDGTSSDANNLHSIWDAALGTYLQFPYNKENSKKGIFTEQERNMTELSANDLLKETDIMESALQNTDVKIPQNIESWVVDSYKIAVKNVYTDLVLQERNNSQKNIINASFVNGWTMYQNPRKKLIETQIAKSGLRLSYLLNAIFDTKLKQNSYRLIVSNIINDTNIKPLVIK